MSGGRSPQIYIDVKYLQPGDIIRSIVDDNFQVRVERPSLRGTSNRHHHPEPLTPERAAAAEDRRKAREAEQWLRS